MIPRMTLLCLNFTSTSKTMTMSCPADFQRFHLYNFDNKHICLVELDQEIEYVESSQAAEERNTTSVCIRASA